tara:strand:- start:46 stop:297 length:252 start_codon:yes stop_codon:yes gene_type:complete
MSMAQKIVKIGNSLGVTIPKDSAEKLGWNPGDSVDLDTDNQTGEITISLSSTDNLSQEDKRVIKHGLDFIKRYRKDLKSLADK